MLQPSRYIRPGVRLRLHTLGSFHFPRATLDRDQRRTLFASRLALLVTMALAISANPVWSQSAIVTTDRSDYQPGDTVRISGTGWQASETVQLVLHEEPTTHADRLWAVVADGSGSFTDESIVTQDHDAGVTFTLTASGQSSGWTATAQFTDAPPPTANLEQARNGTPNSPNSPVEFQNGNLGSSNAHFLEGHSIPYRIVFENLTAGTSYDVVFEWDIRQGGKNGIDYITHFDRIQPHSTFSPAHSAETIDPLDGLSGSFSAPLSFPIPVPSSSGSPVSGQPTTSFLNLPLSERMLTIYNGTITAVTYEAQGSLTAMQSTSSLRVTFTASNDTVVIAYGGHISTSTDWGAGNSAASVQGAPIHSRIVDFEGRAGQDRSFNVDAIVAAPSCEIHGDEPICAESRSFFVARTDGEKPVFSWSISGDGSIDGSTTDSTVAVNTSSSGSFTLTVFITAGGAQSTCERTVTLAELPACSIDGPDTMCPGDTVTYSAPAAASYEWMVLGDAEIVGANGERDVEIQVREFCGALFEIILTVTGENGCQRTCSRRDIRAGDETPPEISCPPDIELTCAASTDTSNTGGAKASDNCAGLSVGYSDQPVQGGIDRTWTATDICKNQASCTQRIKTRSAPAPQASTGGPVCEGETLNLYASTVQGATYAWTGPHQFASTEQNPTIPNARSEDAGTYCVTATVSGCTSAPSCVDAVVNGRPRCSITGPTALAEGLTGQLCGPTGFTYAWSTGATSRCIDVGPGMYQLIVSDPATGCSDTCSFTIAPVPCRCVTGYPDRSNPPKSQYDFREQSTLRAFAPQQCPTSDSLLRVWYSDNASILLGVRRIERKTPSGKIVTDFPVTPAPTSPTCVWLPRVGATDLTGLQAGTDFHGLPVYPALYVTDITNDPFSRSGDWQQGGTIAYPPTKICGKWKAAVRLDDPKVAKSKNKDKMIKTDSTKKPKNHWNLGAGSDAPPQGFASLPDKGYGAEVAWNLNQLPLVPGRTYRLYFTIFEGGECPGPAQGCVTVHIPVNVSTSSNVTVPPSSSEALEVAQTVETESSARDAGRAIYELNQNYPNPFALTTTIRYALPERSDVSLRVFSVLGQEVATLAAGTFDAGAHSFQWRPVDRFGHPLPPGVYVYRMQCRGVNSGAFSSVKKMIYIR